MLLLLARCRLGAPSALARSPVRWRCAYRLRTVELHDGGGGGGSYPVVIKGTNLWTVNQARALIDGVSESRSEFNTVDWQKVADGFPDRTPRACKSKYRLLMRDMALAAGAGHTLRLAKGAYELVAREKEAWTPDDDETLLALHEVWATKWDRIAKSIGKYTPAQCQGRYYWIRKKKRKQAATGDDQSPAKNRTGEQQAKKELPRVRDPKHWSEAEDRKLRDLLIKHGRLDRHAASELLPGFSLAHIYYELDKALSGGPHLAEGMWTAAEHRALLALVERHGRDWRAISHAMPTNRSATQCRLRYACCSSGPVTKHRWTADEEERLRLLVDLCQQGKLNKPNVARAEEEGEGGDHRPLGELSSAALGRFSSALKKDALIPEEPPLPPPPTPAIPVSWPLVSLYMMTYTATQCRTKWEYMRRTAHHSECFRGPWTREEDARLYALCQQAPNRWTWIAARLVRPRGVAAAKARYTSYICRYIDMLRKCRGAGWDPMADHFEEVHMRCEVHAWSRHQLEGYRPHDPYICPYHLDLTGINSQPG